MDANWFKKKQKEAGVTADTIAQRMGRDRSVVSRIYIGRQRMKLSEAKIFAEVLGVPLNDVLHRAGLLTENEPGPTAAPIAGFGEGDAAPYTPGPAREAQHNAIAGAMGAGPGVDVWQVKTDCLLMAGYHPGDRILVDTHQSERCRSGDVVIAQAYNRYGSASTLLRRYQAPFLVTQTAGAAAPLVDMVDGNNVVIRGKVVACWRRS